MIVSSRTPEGDPNRCVICGKRIRIEPSEPSRDAPCPRCGHLNWWTVKPIVASVEPLDFSLESIDLDISGPSLDRCFESPQSIHELPDSQVHPADSGPASDRKSHPSIPDKDKAEIESLGELVAYFERMGGGA